MAMNFDVNKIRYITRGEVNGSVRFLVTAMCAAAVWMGAYWFSGMAAGASSSLALYQARYAELNQLAAEYKSLTPALTPAGEVDVVTVFAQVSARIELGSRVTRISPMPGGTRCFVEVNRLYAEELTGLLRELEIRGVKVVSAEIFTIPVGAERLFRLSFTIGAET